MISFVGAGPGAPDLITLRGAERLATADVVIFAGSLVPATLLDHCRADVIVHDSKGMTLEDVCAVFVEHPAAAIVRLHSGDTSIYSAIGEQLAWCRANGHEFEVVPGVSSLAAAAAAAGAELTSPGVSQSVVLTRLAARTKASMPDRETIAAFSATGATLALFLSVANVKRLVDELLSPGSAYHRTTPVVVAHRVSWPDERLVRTTIGEMVAAVTDAGFASATLFLVGPALADADDSDACRSHVYAPSYTTRFRDAVPTDG